MNPLSFFVENLSYLLKGPKAIDGWANIQMWGWVMLGVVFFILVIFATWLIRLFLSLTRVD